MPKRRTKAKNTTDASNSTPRKRTRRSTRLNTDNGETDEAKALEKDNHPSTKPSDNGSPLEASAPSTPPPPHNGNDGHSDSDSDDHMDWEHIDMSAAPTTAADMEEEEGVEDEQPVTYQDVEVVFEAPRAVLKKSKWEQAYERNMREWLNHSHVVLLVAHFAIRNRWCSSSEVQAASLSCVPEHIQHQCRQHEESESKFAGAIKALLGWWKSYFKLTGIGPVTRAYDEFDFLNSQNINWESDHQPIQQELEKRDMLDGESITSSVDLLKKLVDQSGCRDTSAELFVAVIRSLGFDARLVCSLQPVPYRIPTTNKRPSSSSSSKTSQSNEPSEDDGDDHDASAPKRKPKFPLRAPRPRLEPGQDLDEQLKATKGKSPTVWAEVYNPHHGRWICVDPIRSIYDQPKAMHPSSGDKQNFLSCVLAFDQGNHGKCVDVTRRYALSIAKARRLRERELTKREKEAGMRSWWDGFYHRIRHDNNNNNDDDERYAREQEEMERMESKEPMPTSISAFNNHPLYALERHLKKFEVLHPREPVLGRIRNEMIYPRSCVKPVHTAETWMKHGRVIRDGEQPVKRVNARAVTTEKKRAQELAKQEGHVLQVACYGEWQTENYTPPPVIDGVVPRNSYGRVDLFTSSMLPKGAAHIPIQGIGKIARRLGIDFAEAVVDFEFVRHRSVPVTNGIVIAKENKDILLEAWDEYEQTESNKAIEKHEKQVYDRWRKLILGVLIKARLERDYSNHHHPISEPNASSTTTTTTTSGYESFLRDRHRDEESSSHAVAGGGFVVEESAAGGGFLPEDEEDDL